jgi:hypothetical protein
MSTFVMNSPINNTGKTHFVAGPDVWVIYSLRVAMGDQGIPSDGPRMSTSAKTASFWSPERSSRDQQDRGASAAPLHAEGGTLAGKKLRDG